MSQFDSAANPEGWEPASPEFMRMTLLTLLVGSLVYAVAIRWIVPDQPMRTLAPFGSAVLSLVGWRVLATHGVWQSKRVLGLGGLVLAGLICVFNGGVLAPVVMGVPVLLVMMGWLFSQRAVLWASALTVLAIWSLVAGAALSWLPEAPHTTPAMYGLIQTLMVVLTTHMTLFMVTSYRNRLNEIGKAADELSARGIELEASKRRLQTMIDVSGTVFWEYDIATDSLSYDLSGLTALGLDTSQPPTNVRSWLALVHPDDKHRFLGLTLGTVSTALPALDHDYRVRGAGGEWVWVHTRGAIIRTDATGQPKVLGGGIVNIQARKQAEVALQASEQTSQLLAQMLRSLCDNVPDMIWAKDLNHRYVFANKAMCEQLLMAQDPNEPVGKDDLYFARRQRAQNPDNPHWHTFGELCQDSDTVTLNQGSAAQFEESGNVQGQWLVLDVRKAPFVNEAGQTVGVVGTGRNVTEEKAANDRLRLASLVLEHSSEALMITDEHNTVIEVNPAFTSLTGYSRAEILGQKPSVLRSGQQNADFYRRMWEALKTDGNWQGEIWNRRKDGAVFVEWLSINTLYDPDGQPHRRVALFSDVTEKKKKEEMLWQQANFDLLTLLPNRRMFQDRLGVELKKLHRSGNKLAVFFMDLDHFKEVNDTLGHNLGDQLLMQVAKRILGCVRDSDTVARLGGDEFTVILTDIDNPASAERVAQAVVSALVKPFDLDGDAVQVSVSVGIAISPDHSSEPAALLQLADQAMYLAKREGRNGYRFSQAHT